MNRFVIDYISKLLNEMVDNIMKHNPDIQNHRKHNPDTQNHRKLEKFELIITAGTSPPLCIFHSIYNKVDFWKERNL